MCPTMPLLRHCATLAVRRGLPSPSARAPSSAFARVSKCYSTPIGVNTPQSATDPSLAAPPPNLPLPRPTDIAPRWAAEGRAARRAGRQRPPSLRNRSVARRRPPDLQPAPDIAPRRAAAGRAARSAGRRLYPSLLEQSVASSAPPNLPPPRPTGARHWAKV